jgi:23S rRNA pseudouridine1911/1915/1917 synthase
MASLIKEATVPLACYGDRTDVVLAQLFPEFSRSQLTQWLKQGIITVGQAHHKPKDKVCGGECVVLYLDRVHARHEEHLAENIPLDIVFEDDSLLVINKPAGLIIHPGAGNPQHTLMNALLHHDAALQQLPRAGIVHRLDKDTTGLLLIAKTLACHTALIRQMQERAIERHYLALVHGHVVAGKRIETGYGRDPRNRLKMAVCQQGKEAITEFTVRQRFSRFTLLDVRLHTGRTHQIRVHMAHIHHPVVGDPLYGGKGRVPAGLSQEVRDVLLQFKRQALHAYSLMFKHPLHEELLAFTAPLPEDFQYLLTMVEKDV